MKKLFVSLISIAMAAVMLLLSSCAGAVRDPAVTSDPGRETGTDDVVVPAVTEKPSDGEFKGVNYTRDNDVKKLEAGELSDEFRKKAAEFSLDLLRNVRLAEDDSIMISPLSVMTALAMVTNGAQEKTLAELVNLLGGDKIGIDELNRQIRSLYAGLTSTDGARFSPANSMWITTKSFFHLKKSFLDRVCAAYDAEVVGVDFEKNQETADIINKWTKEKTDGMIPSIINADALNEHTLMVLINALSFEGLWRVPYDRQYHCRDAVFRGSKGDTTVTMMYGSNYTYMEGKNETGFKNDYKDGKYSFVALLPNKEGDINDYLKNLDGDTFISLVEAEPKGKVQTGLPVFKSDYSASLVSILNTMGVKDAFDRDLADFGAIGTLDNGNNIYISDVIHKTHIEVDNNGTKAAAATAVMVAEATGMIEEKPNVVILDRPFVYAIIDNATGLPLFIGTCENIG